MGLSGPIPAAGVLEDWKSVAEHETCSEEHVPGVHNEVVGRRISTRSWPNVLIQAVASVITLNPAICDQVKIGHWEVLRHI